MMETEKDAYLQDSVFVLEALREMLDAHNLVLAGADLSEEVVKSGLIFNNNLAKATITSLMKHPAIQGIPRKPRPETISDLN